MLIASDPQLVEQLARLAPFVSRSRLLVTGREQILRHGDALAFAVLASDLSEGSRRDALRESKVPLYAPPLTSQDLERLYGLRSAKLVGCRSGALAGSLLKLIKPYHVSKREQEGALLMPRHPRVAILGASGIGRFHAAWWAREGVEVAAFLGSSPETVPATAQALAESIGQTPAGYSSLDELMDKVQPDIVDVCLPNAQHYSACKAALSAGAHVICEKPLCVAPGVSSAELLQQADELIAIAAAGRRLFGMNSQYYELAQHCRRMVPAGEELRSISGEVFSPLRKHVPGAEETWLDLGPHLIIMLQALMGWRVIQKNTLHLETSANAITLYFQCAYQGSTPDRAPVKCRLAANHCEDTAQPPNRRYLKLNNTEFDARGFIGEDGVFRIDLHTLGDDQPHIYPDFMHSLLHNFRLGKVLITGEMAKQNLAMLLEIHDLLREKIK